MSAGCTDSSLSHSFPLPAVGALVFKQGLGEVLMIRSRKWAGKWGVPGGKIKYGEEASAALEREVKEETGLEIGDSRLMMVQDCIEPKEFYKPSHFVILMYLAYVCIYNLNEYDPNEITVQLNSEGEEYCWITPQAALALDLNEPTRKLLLHYLHDSDNSCRQEILIHELSLSTHIGVSEKERSSKQTLVCSLKCFKEHLVDKAAPSDELSSTINYDSLAACMRRVADAKPRKLVETLVHDIAQALLVEFPLDFVKLEIRKNALPDAKHVAILFEKYRPLNLQETHSADNENNADG